MRRQHWLGAVACALVAAAAPSPAFGQQLIDLVPSQEVTDERGVDIAGAIYRHHEPLLRIGAGAHPLALDLTIASPGQVLYGSCIGYGDIGGAIYLGLNSHAYYGNTGGPAMSIVLPYHNSKFAIYGSGTNTTIIPGDDHYMTVAYDPARDYFNYIGVDGTEATFSAYGHIAHTGAMYANVWGGAEQIRFPDGETWTYRYNDVTYNGNVCAGGGPMSRVRSIVSSRGYAIQFDYASNATGTLTSPSAIRDWVSPVRATAYNKASVYCNEALLQSCASVTALNSAVTFSYDRPNSKVTITKANGETVELTFNLASTLNLTHVTRPGNVSRTMTYTEWVEQEGPSYRFLTSLTEAGRTWGYGSSFDASNGGITYVGEPDGEGTVYYWGGGLPYLIVDPLLRQTSLSYAGSSRFQARQYPEGNQVTAGYDARFNLNLVRHIPTAGSTLEASATYPATCTTTDRRSCNRPTSTTDRNGNTTDYTYDPAHGGILTETAPLVPTRQNDGSIVNVRPQKRYEYAQRHAWISNGSGGYAQAATPIWVPVRERYCRTTAASGSSCAGGAADEVVIDYDYGPNSGPNNLLLRGQAVTSTDGGVATTLRTCYRYDTQGRRISETQPNANLASCP